MRGGTDPANCGPTTCLVAWQQALSRGKHKHLAASRRAHSHALPAPRLAASACSCYLSHNLQVKKTVAPHGVGLSCRGALPASVDGMHDGHHDVVLPRDSALKKPHLCSPQASIHVPESVRSARHRVKCQRLRQTRTCTNLQVPPNMGTVNMALNPQRGELIPRAQPRKHEYFRCLYRTCTENNFC